jgi:hypothetical protein
MRSDVPKPTTADVDAVIAKYSTPGLRKNQFTRDGKKDWLSFAYPKMSREERDKLLDEIFPVG